MLRGEEVFGVLITNNPKILCGRLILSDTNRLLWFPDSLNLLINLY